MSWQGNKLNPVPNIGNVKSDLSHKIVQESSNLSEKRKDVNRAYQTRRDTDTQKSVSIKLIDIDTAIMKQLEKFKIMVVDDGSEIKVPIYYASPENWKSITMDGIIRDYNGKLILPAMVFNRTTSEKDQSMMMFNRYLTYSVLRQYSEKNRYTKFNLLAGKNVPVHEIYDIVMPDHMLFTYHFIVWTEYVEQMNTIIERINFETEDYWGEERRFKFRTKIDSYSHTIELQVDQDRMVKTEFDLHVNGYLLPDINYSLDSNKPTNQKRFTPKKIVMGMEVVATDFDFGSLDSDLNNRNKWRNKNYPNLPEDEVILPPPISISKPLVIPVIPPEAIPLGPWTFPAPVNSTDPGTLGEISYDDDYYYVYYTSWKRAPKVLVNEISPIADEIKWVSFDNDYIYITGSMDRIAMSLFTEF